MGSNEPIIEFSDVTFKYRAQQEPTLKNINLKIYPGEKILIAGQSGSGKSTLMQDLIIFMCCSQELLLEMIKPQQLLIIK